MLDEAEELTGDVSRLDKKLAGAALHEAEDRLEKNWQVLSCIKLESSQALFGVGCEERVSTP